MEKLEQLRQLKILFYDEGLLTESEYTIIKAEVFKEALNKPISPVNESEIKSEPKIIIENKNPPTKERKFNWAVLYIILFILFLLIKFLSPDSKSEKNNNDSGTINNTGSSTESSGSSSMTLTCSWCGKSFSGTHYTHLGKLAPCQSSNSSNSIGTFCSMRCCSEARRSSCPSCR